MRRKALEEGHDLIVVGGGDGRASSVPITLAGTDAVLGVLPPGTANGLVRTLRIPSELRKACALVAHGVVTDVDLRLAGDHLYLNAGPMSIGTVVAEL